MNRVQVGTVAWSGATADATTIVTGSGGSSDVSCAHVTATGTVSVSDAGGDFSSVIVGVSWAPAAGSPATDDRAFQNGAMFLLLSHV